MGVVWNEGHRGIGEHIHKELRMFMLIRYANKKRCVGWTACSGIVG